MSNTMFACKFSLFCLIGVLCSYSCAGNSNMISCVETDKQALLKLKKGFVDELNILSSWRDGVDCCKWKGISCNNSTGHVIKLDLQTFNYSIRMRGKIDYSLCELRYLTFLNLSYNNFEGRTIPKCIGNLPSLSVLYLRYNNLSGPIPRSLGNLTNLVFLSLSHNNLSGPIPQSFGHLPYLSILDLSHNNLSGPLSQLTGLQSLTILDLSHNGLNETLPHGFGQLSSLVELYLSSNRLNGVISEVHLSNLSNLIMLDVSQNLLAFNLSSNWIPPFDLVGFFASHCILGPHFPMWLKYQKQISALDISNSGISDSIPEWFWDQNSSFEHLNFSHNKIYGSLTKVGKRQWSDYFLDFSYNNFSGPLPHFPVNACGLLLSNNKFTGSISSFCAKSQTILEYFDVSGNLLSGRLPTCLGLLQNLKVLNLAKNNFSGRIPNSIGTLQQIETIHLNNNNFTGEMPLFLHCRHLKLIDFGENNMNGTLPTWMGHNLPNMIVLRLRAHKFQGIIPASLCNLLHLQILDLSQNHITGNIPHCLNNIYAFSNLNSSRQTISYEGDALTLNYNGFVEYLWIDKALLVWKGRIYEYEKNLGLMTAIDLSSNNLEGEIPYSITRLVALASLNLSGNHLTGYIPNNIGQLKMLESLDLSRNSLFGEIPASLSSLTFLSYLNLSFNNLSGKIPTAAQLQTFNTSTYMGNQGLCGPPLPKECPGDESSPNPRQDIEENADEFINFGFYVSMAFGFIIGFWGVCGSLILKTSWRQGYFQFIQNANDWIYIQVVVSIARMKGRFQH